MPLGPYHLQWFVPNLKLYTGASVVLASWTLGQEKFVKEFHSGPQMNYQNISVHETVDSEEYVQHDLTPYSVFISLPLLNLYFTTLIVLTLLIKNITLGPLRVLEQQKTQDYILNFILYKAAFVFGVVDIDGIQQALLCILLVSFIGVLHIGVAIAKQRILIAQDEVNSCPLYTLLSISFMLSSLLLLIATPILLLCLSAHVSSSSTAQGFDFHGNMEHSSSFGEMSTTSVLLSSACVHSVLFLWSEIFLLFLHSCHVLFSWMAHNRKPSEWFTKAYFHFHMSTLLFDLLHHVHMLVCCNLFLSMTSLLVSLQMRSRVRQIHSVLKKRHTFTWLRTHIKSYPLTEDEGCQTTEVKGPCIICWESQNNSSRKLPCGHLFHSECLHSWLLVCMSCPTCRLELHPEKKKKKPDRVALSSPSGGLWGILRTGEILLDLFGGWEPSVTP